MRNSPIVGLMDFVPLNIGQSTRVGWVVGHPLNAGQANCDPQSARSHMRVSVRSRQTQA
jgi:hypothetical protein